MWRDNLRGIFYIGLKDIKTYYLKPPAISWGIVFPITWVFAFYLRNQMDFKELVPGLIAMTILFSITAAEAVVINFELRLGSLERLLLAPASMGAVITGKIFGGVLFSSIMTTVITIFSISVMGVFPNLFYLILIIIPSLFVFATLGALLCVTVKEVFEAQTLLNLPRFLMIFLSGVVYPVSKMPILLQYLSFLLPLTYTVQGLRFSLSGASAGTLIIYFLALLCFLLLFLMLTLKFFYRRFI